MKKTDWIKARIIDKTHPKYGKVVDVKRVEDTRYFDVHNSCPCYPAKIVLFKDFTPNWNPDWNWNDYCANRAAASK